MTRRLFRPPEALAEVALRSPGLGGWHLVRGEVLALPPPGSLAVELPFEIPTAPKDADADADAPVALARVDVEEVYQFGRPGLTTVELARDLYLADGTGGALLRIAAQHEDHGRLHPDVELHLGAPFVERALDPPEGALSRAALVRVVRVGDPLYVFGRARVEQDTFGLGLGAGYRDSALMAVFDAAAGPLHLYDELAYRQLTAWHALPWYRKLSVLVRNR